MKIDIKKVLEEEEVSRSPMVKNILKIKIFF